MNICQAWLQKSHPSCYTSAQRKTTIDKQLLSLSLMSQQSLLMFWSCRVCNHTHRFNQKNKNLPLSMGLFRCQRDALERLRQYSCSSDWEKEEAEVRNKMKKGRARNNLQTSINHVEKQHVSPLKASRMLLSNASVLSQLLRLQYRYLHIGIDASC